MKIYVKQKFNDKHCLVWFDNQNYYCQIINPKWYQEWLNVKEIILKYKINEQPWIVVELE